MSKQPHFTPFTEEDQRIYSKLPTDEKSVCGHDPCLMTPGESLNVNKPINQKLCLSIQV